MSSDHEMLGNDLSNSQHVVESTNGEPPGCCCTRGVQSRQTCVCNVMGARLAYKRIRVAWIALDM